MNKDFIQKSRNEAITWARELKRRNPDTWVILDTETTGLGPHDEVVQIGITSGSGKVLVDNQLIKPGCVISEGAYGVHGISHVDVENAPTFHDFSSVLANVVRGKLIVIYNSDYDTRILVQSDKMSDFRILEVAEGINCAMLKYAEYMGEWNDYRQSFRWQKLPAGDHSAVGDCLATLKIINKMAEG